MNKKLVATLILVLVVNLLAAPMVMAEETDQEEEETYTLDELVVIASKHPEKLSETSVSVEKIDEEDIEQKNAHNVADLLRDVSSVNINDQGGPAGQKSINIRGSSSKQVLVLVDGQEINDFQGGGVDLSQLPIEHIKEIEVLKGPASSLYGADALGGVINITTKGGSEESLTNVEVDFGSFETQEYTLTHRGSTDKLGYNISVTKKESDGHRENPDNSDLDQENIFTKFNYELDDYSDLILSLRYNDSDKGVPGSLSLPSPNARQEDEEMNINLQWDRKTEDTDMNLTAYYNDHDRIFGNPDDSMHAGLSEHEKERKGLEFIRTDYYQAHTLTYGVEYEDNELNTTEYEGKNYDTSNEALFIQDEWQATKDLKFDFGGRYDDHEDYGSEFSPRAGAVYDINSGLNLHVSASEAYRAPTFDDLYWYEPPVMYGNPDLNPETARAYETGLRYSNEDLKGELNSFKKDVEDMIDWAEEDDGTWRVSNVDSAEITGAELILNKKLTSDYSIDFNYTYLDARDEETDERLDDKAYHTANLGLNYNQGDINVNLDGKLVSERYSSGKELPSYFTADLKLNRELTDDAKISLEINNLLDRDYQVLDGYPMPGRNVMLELSREF